MAFKYLVHLKKVMPSGWLTRVLVDFDFGGAFFFFFGGMFAERLMGHPLDHIVVMERKQSQALRHDADARTRLLETLCKVMNEWLRTVWPSYE